MKQETYDIPAFKFALVIPRNKIYATENNEFVDELNNYIQNNDVVFVPWENCDGLTMKETLNIIKQSGFAFICYTIWEDKETKHHSKNVTLFFLSIVTPNYAQSVIDQPLDKIIEKDMAARYNISDEIHKKIFRCFFERYQDKNYQETVERVKKL